MRSQEGYVGLVTGIRTEESTRRALADMSVPVRKEGRRIWISPILDWTKSQCSDLIEQEGFRRNEVVDLCHRSGECLCGALARAEEIREIELWYPEVAARIHRLEERCEERGLASSTWASGESRRLEIADGQTMLFSKAALTLCSSCEARA